MSTKKKRRKGQIAPYIADRINLRDLGSSLRVLCLLEDEGPTSQIEASRRLSLSAGTCNLHFQRLEHEGLIRRIEHVRKGRGRPTVVWGVDGERNFCASLVFDVPFFQASLTDFSGMVVHQQRRDLTGVTSQAEVLQRVDTFIRDAIKEVKTRGGMLRQVFIAVPGLLEPGSGTVRKSVNFPVLDGLNVRGHIEQKHQLPCYAGSLGLAFYYGETEELTPQTTVMVIHWDLGVGVVFGRNDHIISLTGGSSAGGQMISELGHVRVVRGGRPCHCGNHGCLEAYTGGGAILRELDRPDIKGLDDLVKLAIARDREVLSLARGAARLMGKHLAWPIQVMGVEKIIVSGPMAPVFDRVRSGFLRGLASAFEPAEIEALDPTASPAPQARMQRGAHRLGKRLFFHPEDYQLLPRAPATLRG